MTADKQTDTKNNLVQDILANCAERAKAGKDGVTATLNKASQSDIDRLTRAIDAQLARVQAGDSSGIGILEKDGVTEESVTQFVSIADKAKAELHRLHGIAKQVSAAGGDLSGLDDATFEAVGGFRNDAFGVLTAMDIYLGIPVNASLTAGEHVAIAKSAKNLNDAGRLNDAAADYYDREERTRLAARAGLSRSAKQSIH